MTLLKVYILLILFLFPFGELLRFQINNHIAVKPVDVVVGITAITWIVLQLHKKYKEKFKGFKNNTFALPFTLFISVGLIALLINLTWLAPNQFFVSLLYWFRWVSYALLFPIVLQFEQSFKKRIGIFLFIDGLIILVLGYLQYFFYNSLKNVQHLGWDEHMHRMVSVFLDPNFAGAFFVLFFLLLGGILLQQQRISIRYKGLLGIIFLFALLAVFLTFSRSSFLMLLAASAAFLIVINRKKLMLFVFGAMLLFTLAVSPQFYNENMNLFRIASSMARIENYQVAITIITDHPIIGVGFNSYRYTKDLYGLPRDWIDAPSHADAGVDNSFLFVLATTGIIGGFCYGWFWLRVLRQLLGEFRKKKNILAVVAFSSVIGLFVHSLFVNSLFFAPLMLWYFVLLGLQWENEK